MAFEAKPGELHGSIGTVLAGSVSVASILSKIHDTEGGELGEPEIDAGILDSKRLQMFYASVKHGSFAAAAQSLCVSPSAISHAMKSLEEDFGCALFKRSGPQVQPTHSAIRLLPLVRDLLVKFLALKHEFVSQSSGAERLAFRVSPDVTHRLRAPMLSSFCECFPTVDFEIIVRDEVTESMGVDFEIDALQRVPAGMVRRDLVVEKVMAYVAPFHELGEKSRIAASELRRWLLIFSDPLTYPWLLENAELGVMKKWLLSNSRLAQEMAEQGQGVAFLPQSVAERAVKSGALVPLVLQGPELLRPYGAWWAPNRPLTWVAEVFLDLFAESIRGGSEDV